MQEMIVAWTRVVAVEVVRGSDFEGHYQFYVYAAASRNFKRGYPKQAMLI